MGEPAHDAASVGPESDRTLIQPEDALRASKDLSVPQGVEQSPAAPRIPGYILTQALGKGAFAEVWKAWQVRTRKWVAVKVFSQRKGVNWVFLQREMERLIRLDKHPHIVSLLDADLEADPAYYVMDLMEGGSLERFVEKGSPAPLDKAAQWLLEACDALAYVHSKGLIHCDLKPANLLIDEQGHVRVADFGQSRIVTESAGALGTLFYMAPEQAVPEDESARLHPDVRWDIYALGATAYAVMTGKVPWGKARADIDFAKSLKERLEAYRRAVRQDPPLDCRAAAGGLVDEDLSAIVAKCAAVSPEDRYADVGEVRRDLAARLERRPVSPLAGSAVYRLKRFAQRNTALVALAAAALVALSGAGARIVRQQAGIRRELASSYVLRGRNALDMGDAGAAALYFAKGYGLDPAGLRFAAADARMCLRDLLLPEKVFVHGGVVSEAAVSPDGSRIVSAGERTVLLWDVASAKSISPAPQKPGWMAALTPAGVPGGAHAAFFSPDGRLFASIQATGDVLIGEAGSGAIVADLSGWPGTFSPDGRLFAIGSTTEATVQLYDTATWKPKGRPLSHEVRGKQFLSYVRTSFSPDSRRLVTSAGEHFIVWDAATGKRLVGPVSYEPGGLALMLGSAEKAVFSPDGKVILAWVSGHGRLFDAATGKQVGVPFQHEGDILDAAFSPGGGEFATAGADHTVRVWHGPEWERLMIAPKSAPGSPMGRPGYHEAAVNRVCYSGDGKLLLTASADKTARLWDPSALDRPGKILSHAGGVESAVFSADGDRIVTASRDGTVRVWRVPRSAGADKRWRLSGLSQELNPDGSTALGLTYDSKFQFLDLRAPKAEPREADSGIGIVRRAVFSADGSRFLLTSDKEPGEASLWDARTGQAIGQAFRPDHRLWDAQLSPDGKQVLLATDGGAQLWGADGRLIRTLGPASGSTSARFSPDGRLALLASVREARVWSVADGRPVSPPVKLDEDEQIHCFSPDGGRFVVLGLEHAGGRIISAADGRGLGEPLRHEGVIHRAVFSRDGRRLATVSDDGTAQLWDAWTAKPLTPPMRHPDHVNLAAFSPDGELLATGGFDGYTRLWNARTGEPVGRPLAGGSAAGGLEFSADGRRLLAGGSEVLEWDLGWALDAASPQELAAQAELLSQRRIDAQGMLQSIPIEAWLRLGPARK